MPDRSHAIVLFSGGLDSTTTLAIAMQSHECRAVSFRYGQRHATEISAAKRIARKWKLPLQIISLDDGVMTGSALTDPAIAVPETSTQGIPVTYVPARNTVFLAHALALAEVHGASDIYIGVNAVDYSGYPDCRPAYIAAFQKMANLATRAGVEGVGIRVHAPLIEMSKSEIIHKGIELGVDYAATISCYQADQEGRACGLCDSCRLRHEGFIAAGLEDPTRYLPGSPFTE